MKFTPLLRFLKSTNYPTVIPSRSNSTEPDANILTFAQLKEGILAELNHHEEAAGVKWERFPYLNRLVREHRPGEFTVFTGPTGSGKTTFMSEYSLDLCSQGVKTLWDSFEVRNVRLAKTMLTQYAGKNLEKHLNEFTYHADAFSKLPMYFMKFHGPETFTKVMKTIAHAHKKLQIEHIVIDNLQFMMGVSTSSSNGMDRFWQQDVVVSDLRKFASQSNCHVTLVVHPRKEANETELGINSIFGGARATQEADNVLILQDKRSSSQKSKKYLQVCKNRFSGDIGVFPLEFDKETVSFGLRQNSSSHTREASDHVQVSQLFEDEEEDAVSRMVL